MFDKILGNEKIKLELINSIKTGKYSHSYLFLGISGIGKKMIAREFAKMILCEGEEKYCNKCKSCLEFDSNNNPDFTEIVPDGNNVKIEQIREMQRKIVEQPIISSKKVYIIDDADTMTREAQNCLLKTLEEPPEFANIILIGSNESSFLSTIKSRCTIIKFNPISDEQIKEYIKEKLELAKSKGFIDYEDADITTFLIYKMYIALMFDWDNGKEKVNEQMMAKTISKILKSGLRKEVDKNEK